MSYSNPILTAGVASNQAWHEVVTSPRHDPGTRAQLEDGRSFYYACNRSTAINAGELLSNAPVDVDFDDLAIATLTEGETSASITSGSGSAKTYAANELTGGYMQVNSGAAGNNGRQYRIEEHGAIASATATTINFEPIREEDFVAATTVTLVPNPFSAVTVSAAVTSLCVGVTCADIPLGSTTPQYFWAQTWGVASVLSGTSGDILGHAMVLHTTDGASIGLVDGSSGDEPQIIGTNMFTSVSADFMPVFLQIAP